MMSTFMNAQSSHNEWGYIPMWHLPSLLLVVFFLWGTFGSAQTRVPYSFKGLRVGLSLPLAEYEFLTKADAKGKGWMRRQSTQEDFCRSLTIRLQECSYVNPNATSSKLIPEVDLLRVHVLDGVVVSVAYVFAQPEFLGMTLALTEKWGPSTHSTTEPYENLFGAVRHGRRN